MLLREETNAGEIKSIIFIITEPPTLLTYHKIKIAKSIN